MEHLQDRRETGLAWHRGSCDEREAIEKAAKEFNQPATKLMAVRWR